MPGDLPIINSAHPTTPKRDSKPVASTAARKPGASISANRVERNFLERENLLRELSRLGKGDRSQDQHWRKRSVSQSGEAAEKANKEFGIDYPEAYSLALKEHNGEDLSNKEKNTLEAYRKYSKGNLGPDRVRTLIYLESLKQNELTDGQKKTIEWYRTIDLYSGSPLDDESLNELMHLEHMRIYHNFGLRLKELRERHYRELTEQQINLRMAD